MIRDQGFQPKEALKLRETVTLEMNCLVIESNQFLSTLSVNINIEQPQDKWHKQDIPLKQESGTLFRH